MSLRDLLDATTLVVQRSPGFLWVAPRWDLVDPQERTLAQVTRRSGGHSGWGARLAYDVTGADGAALWVLVQRSGAGKSQFQLTSGGSDDVLGTVVQENVWLAPRLRLTTASGRVLHLDGGRMGSWQWSFVDEARLGHGAITRHMAGFGAFVSKQRTYVIERGELLDDELWPLAVMSSICLDIVHDRKAESNNSGFPSMGGGGADAGGA